MINLITNFYNYSNSNFQMESQAILKFSNCLFFIKLIYFMKLLNFSFDIATTPYITRLLASIFNCNI